MDVILEGWRRFLLEASEEEELKRKELVIDVDAADDDFQAGDDVEISILDDEEEEEIEEKLSKKEKQKRKMKALHLHQDILPGYDSIKTLSKGIVEAKKPVKKNCRAYNPYHAGDDGKFVDPDKEKGSYSMASPDTGSPKNCTWGKASRKSSNRSRQAVKQPCGRAGKYRCKDGSEKWEESILSEDEVTMDTAYVRGIIQQELKRFLTQIQQAKGGSCSFADLVRAQAMWSQASEPDKK